DEKEKHQRLLSRVTMAGILANKSDSGDDFLTKDEERRLGKGLRRTLLSDNPSPERVRCPDPKMLRAIAFHKRLRKRLNRPISAHFQDVVSWRALITILVTRLERRSRAVQVV